MNVLSISRRLLAGFEIHSIIFSFKFLLPMFNLLFENIITSEIKSQGKVLLFYFHSGNITYAGILRQKCRSPANTDMNYNNRR